jgi:hypothetical protein
MTLFYFIIFFKLPILRRHKSGSAQQWWTIKGVAVRAILGHLLKHLYVGWMDICNLHQLLKRLGFPLITHGVVITAFKVSHVSVITCVVFNTKHLNFKDKIRRLDCGLWIVALHGV